MGREEGRPLFFAGVMAFLTGLLGPAKPEEGPGHEYQDQGRADPEGQVDAGWLSRDEAPAGFEHERYGVDGSDGPDPALQELQRHEDWGEEQGDEHRSLDE